MPRVTAIIFMEVMRIWKDKLKPRRDEEDSENLKPRLAWYLRWMEQEILNGMVTRRSITQQYLLESELNPVDLEMMDAPGQADDALESDGLKRPGKV